MLYVNQLNEEKQEQLLNEIKKALLEEGLSEIEIKEALENAYNSKLNDLNELINVKKYI